MDTTMVDCTGVTTRILDGANFLTLIRIPCLNLVSLIIAPRPPSHYIVESHHIVLKTSLFSCLSHLQ